jgi:hypothetical protein
MFPNSARKPKISEKPYVKRKVCFFVSRKKGAAKMNRANAQCVVTTRASTLQDLLLSWTEKASDRVPGQRKPITLTRTCRPNNTTLGREIGALFQPHDSPLQILTVAYLWKADAAFVSVEQGSPCLPEAWAAWPDCAEAKWVITQPILMWGGDFRCSCMVDPVCLGIISSEG